MAGKLRVHPYCKNVKRVDGADTPRAGFESRETKQRIRKYRLQHLKLEKELYRFRDEY